MAKVLDSTDRDHRPETLKVPTKVKSRTNAQSVSQVTGLVFLLVVETDKFVVNYSKRKNNLINKDGKSSITNISAV